jgi:ADP-ribose pyrophosphatase YjhB (NUDIX family)
MELAKIKKQILSKLLRNKDWLKYSEIYDHATENDLFNYHLQHLVDKGLVTKKDKKYHISNAGILYSLNEGSIGAQNYFVDKMKVNVLNLVVKKENGQLYILNQQRKRYPFYGQSGISGGVVLKGEKLMQSAKRSLKEKTGLNGEFSKILGTLRCTFYLGEEIFQDIFFFICLCGEYSGQLITENEISINSWQTLNESIVIEKKNHFGWQTLIDLYESLKITPIEKIEYFVREEVVRVDSLL